MNCFRAVCAALGLAGLLAFAAGCDGKTAFSMQSGDEVLRLHATLLSAGAHE